MRKKTRDPWGESALYSLFKSPFLVPSLALHLAIFHVLAVRTLWVRPQTSVSIPVTLLEFSDGRSPNKSIGPDRGPGGPRTLPKRGNALTSRQRTGKIDTGSLETAIPSNESTAAAESAPALPQPKALADLARQQPPIVRESSPDSLIQLPTRNSAATPVSSAEPTARALAVARGTGEGEGIRALKEGTQIPGALKGSGTGLLGAPGGIRDGIGTRGGGTGQGTGGGGQSGLMGKARGDYEAYFRALKKRVESVWKDPNDVPGVHNVTVRFALDRAGKLTQAEVLDSSDSRINGSALEAMKKASPFPAIPETLRDLAGEPLIMRFSLAPRIPR
ncbi:MAG: energy transducer TonB [Deltaproteobacteria bacterium]|nr:energy transducer TonB [Deltaproteobacteria bacterium]